MSAQFEDVVASLGRIVGEERQAVQRFEEEQEMLRSGIASKSVLNMSMASYSAATGGAALKSHRFNRHLQIEEDKKVNKLHMEN